MTEQASPARGRIEVVAGVVGAASLGAEIAAARLIAPYFGASTIVWANTIATVLVALSAGYWLGGRLADRDPTLRGLCRVVLAAAVLLALIPFVSGPFLGGAVDALDSVAAGAFVGSLVAVMVLVAAPVLLLGAIAPYAIRLSVSTAEEAGRVAGRLYAISTMGSLVGVFLAALVLVPFAGTRLTFLAFAVALALVSMIGLARRAAVAAVVLAALALVPVGTIKAAEPGDRVLAERETQYGYARVVRYSDGDRGLELNEGQAIHSLLRADGGVLTGDYWDEPLVLPFAGSNAPRSVAILGSAAGTTARAFGRLFPRTRVDTVEIDGALTELGRRYFDLEGPNLHTHTADARPWMRATDRRFDLIFVDAYRQPYVPFYLATKEFFRLVRDRLKPGGMVVVNVGHPAGDDGLEKVLTATMRSAFGVVLRDPVEPTNTMLVGSDTRASEALLNAQTAAGVVPAPLRATARATAARLGSALRGGRIYTDDVAPVEWLIDASIIKVAAHGERP